MTVRQLVFRQHRFLFVVLGLTLLAALWEVSEPDSDGNPYLRIFPAMWAELYPESADTHHRIATALVEQGDLAEARIHFERALATRDVTKEELFYDYVVLLIRMGADRQPINQAIGNWKHKFPSSTRRDPYTVASEPWGRGG
jgi:tetratricopeptide (TPR) repeat protein